MCLTEIHVQADDGMSLRPGWQRGGRALFQLPESHKDQAATLGSGWRRSTTTLFVKANRRIAL